MTKSITNKIKIWKSSSENKDSPKAQNPTIVVPDNNKSPPLGGGNSTKKCCMWSLKHEIISPKFYELLIKTERKGETDLNLNKLYNHINMCPNEVTILQDELLPAYQSIKRHSDFEK